MKNLLSSFILPFALCIFTFEFAKSQNVGIGTNTPKPSALLELKSTNSGFLPPRMTFTQRNAIINPEQGLMIYCTDCDSSGQPQFFNGIKWCNMLGGTATGLISANLPSVTIGTQIWSSKNLDVATYRNGDPIPQVTDPATWSNLTTGAWCWYNNDSTTYSATYGRLYNWYAVNDTRGLAPQGWHVPTDAEWNKMTKYLDASVDTSCNGCWSGTTVGNQLKNTSGWNSSGNGTNSSGFAGLPGGYRNYDGSFHVVGYYGLWWSASEYDATSAWTRHLDYSSSNVLRGNYNKTYGFSVRVVRDTVLNPVIPTVTTNAISAIANTTATCGGNVSFDGNTSVTARGVCWSTSANPTIALATKTVDGTGTGSFTSSITGLTANTTYYVRAYATNSVGTTYGAQVSFTTTNTSFVNLPSVTIGTQIWSSKNLDVAIYRNGDPIPQVTDATQWANLTTGAWCWYNNDSATYAATYGRLYNWYAVNDPRGLAPQGWHVPTDAEWNRLTKFIDPNADTTNFCCANTAGTAMKSTSGWVNNGNGTNSSGFAGLPGGFRSSNGTFSNVGYYGFWWSASEYDTTLAWLRHLFFNFSLVYRNYDLKANGFSVRVVRD